MLCRTQCLSQQIEVFFPVGVAVGVVFPDAPAWEVFYCRLVEAGGEGIGLGLAFGGVAGPACGIEPFGAVSGSVDVNADEDDV